MPFISNSSFRKLPFERFELFWIWRYLGVWDVARMSTCWKVNRISRISAEKWSCLGCLFGNRIEIVKMFREFVDIRKVGDNGRFFILLFSFFFAWFKRVKRWYLFLWRMYGRCRGICFFLIEWRGLRGVFFQWREHKTWKHMKRFSSELSFETFSEWK